MRARLCIILASLLTINSLLVPTEAHPSASELTKSSSEILNGVIIDPNLRLVENSIIRIKWDLQNPELIREFIFRPLDPNLNLTSYWIGSGSFDDEFTGNSWSINDPQSGGTVVVGRGQIGTWTVITDTLGAAVVTIASVGTQGYPVTTTYRIEADSPLIQVQRFFRFTSLSLHATAGFRPYMFRVRRSLGFDQYVIPLTNGTIITGSATSCPYGCDRSDWAGTWADIQAPTLGTSGVGIAFINANEASPGIWVDNDSNSNSAYIAATPLNGIELLNYDVSVAYRYCVHFGSFQEAEECNAAMPFLDLPFPHTPGDNGFDRIYSFFDHEYPLQRPALGGSEPQTPGIGDTILLFTGDEYPDRWTQPTGFYYSGHDGYDFSVPTIVSAAHDGYAIGMQWPCRGSSPINVISITQGRYQTVYLHLQNDSYWQDLRDNPRYVRTGDPIGTVGNSGAPNCSKGPHLHFGVFYDADNDTNFESGEKVDPYGFNPTRNDPWVTYGNGHPQSVWLWTFSPPAQTNVNPSSGRVLASGNINVNVPFGAVTNPALLALAFTPEPNNDSTTMAGLRLISSATATEPLATRYNFQISAVYTDGTPLTTFAKSITITVPYADGDVAYIDEATLHLYQWQGISNVWIPLATTLDTLANKVMAITDNPGLFSLRGQPLNQGPTLLAVSPSLTSNVGETQIVVTGTNFMLTPRLNLDIASLSVRFISSSTLTATIPSSLKSGTYTLTLRNPDGQITTLPNAITIPFSIYLPTIVRGK